MKLTILLSMVMFLLTRCRSTEVRNTLVDFVNAQLDHLYLPMKTAHNLFGYSSRSLHQMIYMQNALYPDKCWKRGLGTIVPFRLKLTTGVRKAWCDTQSFGGGAITIQKHASTVVNFTKNWNEYAKGFGYVYGDFWLGNDALHELTQRNNWKLKIEGSRYSRDYYSIHDEFRVGPPEDGYRVTVGFLQNGTRSLRSGMYRRSYDVSNMKFTTYDRDNDNRRGLNCGRPGHNGFWYNTCAEIGPNAASTYMIWYAVTGWRGHMDEIEMKIKEFY